MKNSRLSLSLRENASALHQAIGDVLLSSGSLFALYKVYQEYPVCRINPSYSDASHRFDWVVLDLHLVIEGHGAQHYHPVDFGGEGNLKAIDRYHDACYRDRKKEEAAVQAGYTYLAIPWTDTNKLTDNYVWGLYQRYKNTLPLIQRVSQANDYHEEQLKKAREYRHEQYQKMKQKRISNGL